MIRGSSAKIAMQRAMYAAWTSGVCGRSSQVGGQARKRQRSRAPVQRVAPICSAVSVSPAEA